MKKNTRFMFAISTAILTGLVILGVRYRRKKRMLNRVADEGYETAHDVLFPHKSTAGKKLHLGPVIPVEKV
ncbi:MAG: hypothetical protein V9E88_12300 [Ferruginibacter sp.]